MGHISQGRFEHDKTIIFSQSHNRKKKNNPNGVHYDKKSKKYICAAKVECRMVGKWYKCKENGKNKIVVLK
jgi:hypothetical protein